MVSRLGLISGLSGFEPRRNCLRIFLCYVIKNPQAMWNCERTSEFPGTNNYFCSPLPGQPYDAVLVNINIGEGQPGSYTYDIKTPMVATFSGRSPVRASVHVDGMQEPIATATSNTMNDNSDLDCRRVDYDGYCKLKYKGLRLAVPPARNAASCTMAHTDNDGFTARCNVEGPIADVSNVTKHGQQHGVPHSLTAPQRVRRLPTSDNVTDQGGNERPLLIIFFTHT